jgi:signal transduction histidine kinase
VINKGDFEKLLILLNEKEVMLKERELALEEQQEEFLSQKEELTAAVEAVMEKNATLTSALQELKQRNEELDQILYRASHDLRTPVSSILGLIGVMNLTPISAEQQVIVSHLSGKARQMDSLLLSLSRLATAFFQEVVYEHCSLHAVVNDAWKNVKDNGRSEFQVKCEDINFSTDKALLSILLTCLLENANTYVKPDGQNEIVVSASLTESGLSLEVSDGGEEIPKELEDKIFNMFYRGSVLSNGPGLGLYISQRIVERLNGTLRLENQQATKTFCITLPVR